MKKQRSDVLWHSFIHEFIQQVVTRRASYCVNVEDTVLHKLDRLPVYPEIAANGQIITRAKPFDLTVPQ